VYICSDDDLAQLELKNQRLPMPVRPPEFYNHCFSRLSLAISRGKNKEITLRVNRATFSMVIRTKNVASALALASHEDYYRVLQVRKIIFIILLIRRSFFIDNTAFLVLLRTYSHVS
jgi:hypothetical protein